MFALLVGIITLRVIVLLVGIATLRVIVLLLILLDIPAHG